MRAALVFLLLTSAFLAAFSWFEMSEVQSLRVKCQ